IVKDLTADYGFDMPAAIEEAGQSTVYISLVQEAGELAGQIDREAPGAGQYALPLAYRRRALFKMDSAELGYIAEARTTPAGHFSYRDVAYQMYQGFAARYPSLAAHIRVTDPAIEDFFER